MNDEMQDVPKEPIIPKKHFMREVPESECLTELNEIEINEGTNLPHNEDHQQEEAKSNKEVEEIEEVTESEDTPKSKSDDCTYLDDYG